MTMKTDDELIDDFVRTRNLKQSSKQIYTSTINLYTKFNNASLIELLKEAEHEEEESIRWKKRTLKKRLINFRSWLTENYRKNYVKSTMTRIITIYKHYEIEVHDLPPINNKNFIESEPITFKELPDHELIKVALKIAKPLLRAIILFQTSSGCARHEALSITIQDFIDATSDYHNENNIYDVIKVLKNRDDVVPTFRLKREKTNKYYYAFCSPEAVTEMINYLLTITKPLKPENKFFDIHKGSVVRLFSQLNEELGAGKAGTYNRLRTHNMRKFHSTRLDEDGLSRDVIDALQGRGKNATRDAYFLENPDKLKELYMQHMHCLTINLDVNNLDLKSPEFVKLETELNEKTQIIKNYEDEFEKINNRQDKLEKLVLRNIDDSRLSKLNKLI